MGNFNCCAPDQLPESRFDGYSEHNRQALSKISQERIEETMSRIIYLEGKMLPYQEVLVQLKEKFKPLILEGSEEKVLRQDAYSWLLCMPPSFTVPPKLLQVVASLFPSKWRPPEIPLCVQLQLEKGELYWGPVGKKESAHGLGVLFKSNGNAFVGQFEDGLLQGEGLAVFLGKKQRVYKGHFIAGEACSSRAILFDENLKARFVGEIVASQEHGQGIERLDSGTLFAGNYKEGSKQSDGAMLFSDGSIYIGKHLQCIKEREGTYYWNEKTYYTGQWKSGRMSGFGIQVYADGSRYEGEFLEDTKHGHGIFSQPDKSVIEGTWNYGILTGEYKLVLPNGTKTVEIAPRV